MWAVRPLNGLCFAQLIRERGSLPTGFTTAEETVAALISLVEPYGESA